MLPAYHQNLEQQSFWCLDFGSGFGGLGLASSRRKPGTREAGWQNRQKGSFVVY